MWHGIKENKERDDKEQTLNLVKIKKEDADEKKRKKIK